MSILFKFSFLMIVSILFLSSCGQSSVDESTSTRLIYNQVGYITHGPKLALVTQDVNEFVLLNAEGKEVFRATPEAPQYWEASGDTVRKVDFSEWQKEGSYTVKLTGFARTYDISIGPMPYHEVSKAAIKSFYLGRTSIAIEEPFAGEWARAAGHPDTLVYIHASAADDKRPEGTIISSPLGWYDAGDYNKYVVNSGITTYTMLRALKDYPLYYANLDLNIPESGSGIPDLLSETLFNLRWVLSMQDPNDGGVYHKLTTKQFEDFVMPNEAVNDRFVVAKSTAAALNYAALTASAFRVLSGYDAQLPGLSDSCLSRAEKAWDWAVKHPDLVYQQPEDIATGAYGDDQLDDEWFWAASELYLATGNDRYLSVIKEKYQRPQVPTWNQVYALGFYSLIDFYEELPAELTELSIKDDFLALANDLVAISDQSPYGISIEEFAWGSSSQVANEGMIKLFAHQLTGDVAYLNSALSDLDYVLGRNATGFCFVTGFGHHRVMNIHHRPSGADGIEDPVPGFLVGGPNLAVLSDCGTDVERSPFPAKSYVDLECSYSTNEIAINWNAPLVYLVGGIDALMTR
jgi:endoglucanase